jgi:hypothetical protein
MGHGILIHLGHEGFIVDFLVRETPLNLWRQLFVTLIADDAIRSFCKRFDGVIGLFVLLYGCLGILSLVFYCWLLRWSIIYTLLVCDAGAL